MHICPSKYSNCLIRIDLTKASLHRIKIGPRHVSRVSKAWILWPLVQIAYWNLITYLRYFTFQRGILSIYILRNDIGRRKKNRRWIEWRFLSPIRDEYYSFPSHPSNYIGNILCKTKLIILILVNNCLNHPFKFVKWTKIRNN